MNGLCVAGIVLDALFTLVVAASGEYPGWLAGAMATSCGVSVLGAILLASGTRRPGALLVIAGSVIFVPLGVVGILGARKVLDAAKVEELEARRVALRRGASR